MLKSALVQPSDSRPVISAQHTYSFIMNAADDIQMFKFQYCTQPSGACTTPSHMGATNASLNGIGGNADASWTINAATRTQGTVILGHAGDTTGTIGAPGSSSVQQFSQNATLLFTVSQITNPDIQDCNASAGASSDTCYVRISGYHDAGMTDQRVEATASITVVAAVTVSARVDPTFTFVVAGVNASTVDNGITTSVATAYNTLPFGNLTANAPQYAAHKLTVTTNTEAGYTVTMKMVTQMTGVYTMNNIDPYVGGGATWAVPVTWTRPTGTTPNDNTGWIGANTTDTDVSGWNNSPAGKFGPVQSDQENMVMKATSADNGGTSVYVTYGIEANVYQPADTYTGILFYNALPTY
jgi:hypothetical protein